MATVDPASATSEHTVTDNDIVGAPPAATLEQLSTAVRDLDVEQHPAQHEKENA